MTTPQRGSPRLRPVYRTYVRYTRQDWHREGAG